MMGLMFWLSLYTALCMALGGADRGLVRHRDEQAMRSLRS